MLRPTDSPMPIGIGFLLLSFGAKLSSAIPYQVYQLNERDVNTDTTTTDSFVTTTTSAFVAPIDVLPTTSSAVVIDTTTYHDAIVVDTTTSDAAPVVQPLTTTGEIVGDTTSAEIAPVGTETPNTVDVLSSTGAPVENVPTTTSDWIPPPGTETNNVVNTPGPDTTANTDVPPPAGTETPTNEPIVGTTTNTDAPPAGTETATSNVPGPVVDTTTNVPIVGTETGTTSDAIAPVDTTTDVPVPGTETPTTSDAAMPVVDTTTTAEIPPPNTDTPTSSAGVPAAETTTENKNDAPTTTAPVNNAPQTTEKASEPSDKPSDAPSAPVTAPPQEATAAPSQAQATASEYKSKVDDIIPIIVAWQNNPDGLKTDTLSNVNNLINGVKDAITDLGGSTSSGCNGKRKRGLLDIVSNIVNTLTCVVSNLEDIGGKITGGVVDGVTPIVSTLTTSSQDLKEQSEEKEDEDKSKTEKEESETKEESKTEESKTTEKPTSTEATTSATETTETTTGACSMRETTSLPGATDAQPKTSIPLPPLKGGTTAGETSSGAEATTTDSPTSTEATTTAEGPESTTHADTSAQETSTEAAEETSTADDTKSTAEETKSTAEETKAETDTSAPATTRPSTLLTTTRPSPDQTSNTITSGSSEIITSSEGITTAPSRTYYPCNVFGGPRVATPYCQCSTTVSGKQYVATASLIDNQCEAYTEYPSKVDPATEAPPPTQAPINEPLTKTIDGTVLAWTAYTLAYGQVYKDVTVTFSNGIGETKTIATPVPTQTHVDNDGSGQCGTSDGLSKSGLGDACNRAINMFDDNTVYTGYTTRFSRSSKGLLMVASMGQAACIAKFSCDDYGIGMSGKLIKEADFFRPSKREHCPFFAAICNDDLGKAKELINLFPSIIDEEDALHGTPLHVAVFCDNFEAVKLLLAAGADPLLRSSGTDDQASPLRIATRENRPAILYQLWQHIKPIEVAEDYISRRRCLLESPAWAQVFSVILLLD
ncbi:uncharacterized protein QYS62_003255 [Fusarium acuminatum]|uniref:Ankyrin n=1 Tax=Fusarium acuminatum TaxID=5515 RepID=A0ABZ2WPE5_9HYPO